MLSKPATMLLGLIYEKPLNAYEIIKLLNYMNVKWWFNIADSTVYSTLKTLEKKEYILGTTEKVGNMPDRTVYSLSDKGKDEFIATLKASILQFNYDTNIFSIAAFLPVVRRRWRRRIWQEGGFHAAFCTAYQSKKESGLSGRFSGAAGGGVRHRLVGPGPVRPALPGGCAGHLDRVCLYSGMPARSIPLFAGGDFPFLPGRGVAAAFSAACVAGTGEPLLADSSGRHL